MDKIFDARGEVEASIEWALTYSPDSADVLNFSRSIPNEQGERRIAQGNPDYSKAGANFDNCIDTYAVIVTKSAGNLGPASY